MTSGRRAFPKFLLAFFLVLLLALYPARSIQHAFGQSLPNSSVDVDLRLVLAVDCSWSVNNAEFELQRAGLAAAFRSPEILQAIAGGIHGRIVVSVVQWADSTQQSITIPWTIVSDIASAGALAQNLSTMPRVVGSGSTSISAVMRFAATMLLQAPFRASRSVIDIASDGRNNNGGDPRPVRNSIGAAGITINGLTIRSSHPTLDFYFLQNITIGPGHFVETTKDYSDYGRAIKKKLQREIVGPMLSINSRIRDG